MARAKPVAVLLAAFALCGLASGAEPGSLEQVPEPSQRLRGRGGEVTTADVEKSLVSELAGNVSQQRLQELEAALRPMYEALPKEQSGYLGYQSVRYALHRLLLQRHGWFIVGLEPTDEALPPYLNGEWVPQYLQGLLEERLGNRGIDLREIAALAASLEDLVRSEAARRMNLVYKQLHVSESARVETDDADRLLETYMMVYLNEGNLTVEGSALDQQRVAFKETYSDWDSASSWLKHIKGNHLSQASDGKLGRDEMVSIANELGERFGAFNDGECASLKQELLRLEGPRPGRIPLVDFYQKGLYSHWQFNEKVDYLRVLGALDESDELHPSVIVPNYLGSRPNCLTASGLYAVCCRNQCEDLMGHLEREIAAPSAAPERIQALVSKLASATTNSSRALSDSLVQRLQDIAARHGGKVPLHGRLFAQWMHHAYPRECPYPHEGDVNPQTPDEWMKEAGQEDQVAGASDARASEDEVKKILGNCATAGADGAPCSAATSAQARQELPWSDAEVLLASKPTKTESSSLATLLGKTLVLLVLLAIMYFYANGEQAASKEDVIIFEDELKKPGMATEQFKPWKLLLGLLVVGLLLESSGLLDRFSFGCTMAGGLLLNGALMLMRRSAQAKLKSAKCML